LPGLRQDQPRTRSSYQGVPAARHQEFAAYLHDGRLLTLDVTVEFFNVVLGVQLSKDEKSDLVAFLRCL
jgi:hypothetical protein